jgi:hypothetical protein
VSGAHWTGTIDVVGRFVASFLVTVALGAGVLGVAGCGSSQQVDPAVTRAADVVSRVPGYRIDATMNINAGVGNTLMHMTGSIDRVHRTGELVANQTVLGHQLNLTEVFSQLTFYLKAAGIPGLAKVTGGKQWIEFDMSRMLGAMGLSSMPTGSDPSQFVDYLRAVSSSTKSLGTATIRGVATKHYRATIDLSKYASLVPASQRAQAKRGIETLENALGSKTMTMDAWLDKQNLPRQIGINFSECVASRRARMAMTMDLYDFGPQKPVSVPSPSQAYDITPLMVKSLAQLKLGGC